MSNIPNFQTICNRYGDAGQNGLIAIMLLNSYEETTLTIMHAHSTLDTGMRILKEIIFCCVKALNIIQMFQFATEIMERYYQSKLLSVAHTRVDCFVSVQYQGLNAKQYSKDSITDSTERGVWTCPQVKGWISMQSSSCHCVIFWVTIC